MGLSVAPVKIGAGQAVSGAALIQIKGRLPGAVPNSQVIGATWAKAPAADSAFLAASQLV